MSCDVKMVANLKCAFISDLSHHARLRVRGELGVSVSVKQAVSKVHALLDTWETEVEPADEATVELEVSGQVFIHYNSWSEVLYLCKVGRTRGTGLASFCIRISEISWQIILWLSWIIFSLGELIKLSCAKTESVRALF